MGTRSTPKSIKQHKYAFLFASEWQMIHNRMDGNSFSFFIGMNGSGKSYANLKRAEILGVDQYDSYGRLFDPDHLENHVFFDRQEMQNKIAELERLPSFKVRGYQLILEEAQMSANAKQWNDRQILDFSKEMTSIRSSRFSISMNMPTYKMITTDLRQLGTYMVEMLSPDTIDLKRGLSYSKLHLLSLKPYIGEVWRHRPYVKSWLYNSVSGLPLMRQGLLSKFSWERPSSTTCRNYEKLKKEFRKISAEKKAVAKVEARVPKEKRLSFSEVIESVKSNVSNFSIDGKVDWGLISQKFNTPRQTASKIAVLLNKNAVS